MSKARGRAGRSAAPPWLTWSRQADRGRVAFSPDGTTLASGDAGTVRLWDMAYLVDPVSQLCKSAQRSLTPAQWKHDVPTGPRYQAVCR